jgi:two-component system chemotaxis response regulator CheB
MKKIRVLVIDDAVVIRRLVTEILSNDPEIEVVGTAANGSIGLARILQLTPDVVTLDVEMPDMDGFATLTEIRKTHPRLPVIMFSTLTARGAEATLEALAAGASDYVTKPANVGSVSAAQQSVRESLIPKIKALCPRIAQPAPAPAPLPRVAGKQAPPTRAGGASAPTARVDVLAIGVSTGGPNALAALMPRLPGDLEVPVLIVQHMPALFTKILAERLDHASALHVAEARGGEVLKPGHVWIAPGDHHMVVVRSGLRVLVQLNQEPPQNSCRPAVDPLFESVARTYGRGTLAVVLTGMGQDGLRGAEDVHAAGGVVLAQDEASSVVWGMPGAVARAGLANGVLPLDQLAEAIVRRVRGRSGAATLRTGT